MGLIRKVTSLGTLGLVNFRAKDERANKYAKQTRSAARAQVAQNAAQLELQRQQLTALDHGNVREEVRDIRSQPQLPPAGWYPDPADPSIVRWFDGAQWTDFSHPRV